MSAEASEFIGVDVGRSRTGLARGSNLARLAEALAVVPTDRAIGEIKKLTQNQGLAGIVVGLPRNLAGEETTQTQWVREWVDKAKKELKTTFYWQDEALTSKLAEARALKDGPSRNLDDLAAQIILQDFLDGPETLRVIA